MAIVENQADIAILQQQIQTVEGIINDVRKQSKKFQVNKLKKASINSTLKFYEDIKESLNYCLAVRKLDWFQVVGVEKMECVYLGVIFNQLTDCKKRNTYEINGKIFDKLSEVAAYIEKEKEL